MKSFLGKMGFVLIGFAILGYAEVWGADWEVDALLESVK